MKDWVDRVFAYGYRGAGNTYRYGDSALAGKRAMLSVTVGGPADDYGLRGINGPLEHVLFPITHGNLFFPGMDVLPTFAVYATGKLDELAVVAAKRALTARLRPRAGRLCGSRRSPYPRHTQCRQYQPPRRSAR